LLGWPFVHMSGEPFDTGAVFERATPVLSFPPELGRVRSPGGARPMPVRRRLDTPTPGPVTTSRSAQRAALPVVPRIVRRTFVDGDRALLRPLGRAALVARESSTGGILLMALALAAFGALAGTGMRSLGLGRDVGTTVAARAGDVDADATGIERVLVRVPPPPRVERAEEARAEAPAAQPTSTPVAAAPRPHAAKGASPHAAARPAAAPHPSVRHHRRRFHP